MSTTQESTLHVIPVDDLRPHEASIRCWCDPTQDDVEPNIFMHHAMDNREQYEQGRKLQ